MLLYLNQMFNRGTGVSIAVCKNGCNKYMYIIKKKKKRYRTKKKKTVCAVDSLRRTR